MSKKILLLDINYQFDSFIDIKKAIKHIIKDKVEVISFWDEFIRYEKGQFQYPSIMRLKNHINKKVFGINFSRLGLIRRDKRQCQYCSKLLSNSLITIDHVTPKSHGGQTNYLNCVVACQPCNSKKGNKNLEQANMSLIKKPHYPSYFVNSDEYTFEHWHDEWDNFIKR